MKNTKIENDYLILYKKNIHFRCLFYDKHNLNIKLIQLHTKLIGNIYILGISI